MVRVPSTCFPPGLTAFPSERDPHVPDMRTQDGLLDVLALGCVLEFSTALDPARYSDAHDPSSTEALATITRENHARTMFRVLLRTFASKYTILLYGELVHPSSIWEAVLVNFAVGMVNTITRRAAQVTFDRGVSPKTVLAAVRHHLQDCKPHLVGPFDDRLTGNKDDLHLSWNGVPFEIIRKGAYWDLTLSVMDLHEERPSFGLGILYNALNAVPTVNRYYDNIWSDEDEEDDIY